MTYVRTWKMKPLKRTQLFEHRCSSSGPEIFRRVIKLVYTFNNVPIAVK